MFSARFANDSCLITGIFCFYGKQSATREKEREWHSIEVDQERGSGARGNRPERDLLKHQHRPLERIVDIFLAHHLQFSFDVQLLFISSVETHTHTHTYIVGYQEIDFHDRSELLTSSRWSGSEVHPGKARTIIRDRQNTRHWIEKFFVDIFFVYHFDSLSVGLLVCTFFSGSSCMCSI